MNKFTRIVLLAVFMNCHIVLAQNIFSPYTVLGIGDVSGMGMSRNDAMGNVGIATPTAWQVNNMNPALLTYNRLTVFTLGVQGEKRTITSRSGFVDVGTSGLKYLSFAFPIISGDWTVSVGIMPYSSVNYDFTTTKNVEGSDAVAEVQFNGTGGLNQVYFSNGFNLSDGFSVGVRGSFVFGLIQGETTTLLKGLATSVQFPTGVLDKTNYSGLTLGLGAVYEKKLSDQHFLNFGVTYDFKKELSGTRLRRNQNIIASRTISGDTLINDQKFYSLPVELGIGFSWNKLNKITLGLDVRRTFWRNQSGNQDINKYRKTWMVGLGFEFTPKYNDVNNYLSRIKYRFGLNYQQNHHIIQGESIDDLGISLGWSLPIMGISALDMSFKYGQRGVVTDVLVKERYIKFVLGATINDRWFVRRKYD